MTPEGVKPLRYSLALSSSLATLLEEQERAEGASRSAVLAKIVDNYYNRAPAAEYETLRKLETEAIKSRD